MEGFARSTATGAPGLRPQPDPVAVGAERLGQALQVGQRKPTGRAVGLHEREQERAVGHRLPESPIGSVQAAE